MGKTMRFQFDGLDTVENRLLGIPAKVQAVLISKIDIFTALAQRDVQGNLTGGVLNQRSGKLLRSVQVTPARVVSPGVVSGAVGTDDNDPAFVYGIVHEKGGVKAYLIKAKSAKALAFTAGGQTVFAKSVMHPPAKKRSWIGPVADILKSQFSAEMAEAINEVLQ